MKHIFVINPIAGLHDSSLDLINKLHEYDGKIDYEVYITKYKGDTARFVKERCIQLKGDAARFYACGGDGTLNGVLNGLVGFENVEMTHFPTGSGNDFIKYFKGLDFKNLDNLINGKSMPIDILKVNDKYSINIANFGLDAKVCVTMDNIRRKKLIGGKRAYSNAVFHSLIVARKNFCKINVNGENVFDGRMLLCAVANANVYGGGYICAPDAKIDDGILDFVLIKSVPIFKIPKLLKIYKEGKHIGSKIFEPFLIYKHITHLDVTAPKGIAVCLDGETEEVKSFSVDIMPKAIKFVIPNC